MGKKALIITGRLAQDHEYIYPYYRLQEEDYKVDVAIRGKETVLGYYGTKIIPTKDIPDLKVSDYELLVLPGGVKAMEHMRLDNDIIKFIQDFYYFNPTSIKCIQPKRVVASICSAAQLLISADIVKWKKISGYYSMKDDITNAGAVYVDAPAVVDDRIVTSPHYKYLGQWMKAVFEEFKHEN